MYIVGPYIIQYGVKLLFNLQFENHFGEMKNIGDKCNYLLILLCKQLLYKVN